MLTGEIKGQVDRVWKAIWAGKLNAGLSQLLMDYAQKHEIQPSPKVATAAKKNK